MAHPTVLQELELLRKRALLKYVLSFGGPIALEFILLAWAVYARQQAVIMAVSMGSTGFILAGIFIALNIQRKFLKEAKDQLLPEFLQRFLPEARLEGDSEKADFEVLRPTGIIPAGNCAYQEKSVVHCRSFRIWDAEVTVGSGRNSRRAFDGLIIQLQRSLPVTGAALLRKEKKKKLGLSSVVIFFGLSVAFAVPAWLMLLSVDSHPGLIPRAVTLGIALSLSLLITILIRRTEKLRERGVDEDFTDPRGLRDRIQRIMLEEKDQDVLAAILPTGVTLAFPKISDFLEIRLGRSLTDPSLQRDWEKQMGLVRDLMVQLEDLG